MAHRLFNLDRGSTSNTIGDCEGSRQQSRHLGANASTGARDEHRRHDAVLATRATKRKKTLVSDWSENGQTAR